jgi:hypothetical protein
VCLEQEAWLSAIITPGMLCRVSSALSGNGDTPVPSAKPESAAEVTRLVSIPVVGGLHHRYIRVAA